MSHYPTGQKATAPVENRISGATAKDYVSSSPIKLSGFGFDESAYQRMVNTERDEKPQKNHKMLHKTIITQ